MKKTFDFKGRAPRDREKDFWDDFDDEADYEDELEAAYEAAVSVSGIEEEESEEYYEEEDYTEDSEEYYGEEYAEDPEEYYEEEEDVEEAGEYYETESDTEEDEAYYGEDYAQDTEEFADDYELSEYEAADYEVEDAEVYEEEYYETEATEEYIEEYQEEEFDPDAYVAELIEEEQEQEAEYYEQDEYEEPVEAEEELYNADVEEIPEVTYFEEEKESYEEQEELERGVSPISKIMDYMVIFGAVAVLFVALILGGTYLFKSKDDQGSALKEVGTQLDDITMIGEAGLVAMSDAQKAMLAAMQTPEPTATPEPSEYEEEEYHFDTNVKLSLSSIEKDLKIKFLNDDTGKLVGNVPFGVEITNASGDTLFWSDDDMDGIIYKKNLQAGMYVVKVQALADEKYKTYGIPTEEKKVEVKEKIAYEKVDIAGEIKDESQVDVEKEDAKQNEVIEEEYLQDTVPWVESTVIPETYEEVARENIPDPLTYAMGGDFKYLAATVDTITHVATEVVVTPEPVPTAEPVVTEVPTAEPVVIEAPTAEPAVTEVPTAEPVVTETPTAEPVVTEAPTAEPVVTEAPTAEPIVTEAPTAEPVVTEAPTTEPAVTEAPTAEPEVTPEPSEAPVAMVIVPEQRSVVAFVNTPYELKYEIQNKPENAVIWAESSDQNLLTAEVKEGVIILNAKAEGRVTLRICCEANGVAAEAAVCNIIIKNHPKDNETGVLKDNQGREIYVLDNNAYRLATYADYYSASNFYIRKPARYTGWQTLNGQVRYYDAAGNYVTGEQVIQGVKYNFTSEGILITGNGILGIDVSKWNGNIDWNAVKEAGVSYVIIRCGYRGSSAGALIEDSKFKDNIKGASAAGLKIGVYFFTQAIDKNEALEEATMVLEAVKKYNISYPIFLDVEPSGGRADRLDVATRTEICKTFCETIKQYGYTPGIYANKTWLEQKLDMSVLGNYKIWLAQYASEPTYQGRYDLWQYKDTGKINGVTGDVDLNMSYLGY